MRYDKALALRRGRLVIAGGDIMRVLGPPEAVSVYGRSFVRITASDDFCRTHVFTNDEVEIHVGRQHLRV